MERVEPMELFLKFEKDFSKPYPLSRKRLKKRAQGV
jgi:hypothetical protein